MTRPDVGTSLQTHADWLEMTGMVADDCTLALLREAAEEIRRLREALQHATDDIATLGRHVRAETGKIATWAHEIAVRSRAALHPTEPHE